MYIIVGYLEVSIRAMFNRQATVGVASTKNATEYDVKNCGVFTDERIDRMVSHLKAEYPNAEVVYK